MNALIQADIDETVTHIRSIKGALRSVGDPTPTPHWCMWVHGVCCSLESSGTTHFGGPHVLAWHLLQRVLGRCRNGRPLARLPPKIARPLIAGLRVPANLQETVWPRAVGQRDRISGLELTSYLVMFQAEYRAIPIPMACVA